MKAQLSYTRMFRAESTSPHPMLLVWALMAFCVTNTIARGQNLLLNGSFENGMIGWTKTGTVVTTNQEGATNGTFSATFNSGDNPTDGILWQDVSTTPGQSYRVTFDFGAFAVSSVGLMDPQQIIVEVIGNGLVESITSFDLGVNPTSFCQYSLTFVANANLTRMLFRDDSPVTDDVDSVLDNVFLQCGSNTLTPCGLVTNGSFEIGTSGWDITGNALSHSAGGATAGTNALILNSGNTTPNAVISQTVGVTAGRTYELSFDFGGWYPAGSVPKTMSIEVTVIGNAVLVLDTIGDIGTHQTTFGHHTYEFIADATSVEIIFRDTSSNTIGTDGVLDDVDLCQAEAVPCLVGIPTVSEWGVAAMALLTLITGTLVLRRRHHLIGTNLSV